MERDGGLVGEATAVLETRQDDDRSALSGAFVSVKADAPSSLAGLVSSYHFFY